MDVLTVPVPLFSEENAVEAYMFRYRKGNDLLSAATEAIHFDRMLNSPLVGIIKEVGLNALTMNKPIFVPVTKYMLRADIDVGDESPELIVFLIDGDDLGGDEMSEEKMTALREAGFRFAVKNLADAETHKSVLGLCDFIFYDQRLFSEPAQVRLREIVDTEFRDLTRVYTHVDSIGIFHDARKRFKGLYEGRFYRMPFTEGENKISPLQINMINLLNKVRAENFEFDDISKVILRDPALTISLLRLVNSGGRSRRNEIKTINGAVVMLGQEELRKWITTAAANQLGTEKPNEITKLSLIRAKFAESLAVKFGLYADAQSLFLMGIFSVLDAMLEMEMDDALNLVLVSDDIREALVSGTGKYGDVYRFIVEYEAANWSAVSRMLIIHDLATEAIYEAYVEALCWYRDMLQEEPELPTEGEEEAAAAGREAG